MSKPVAVLYYAGVAVSGVFAFATLQSVQRWTDLVEPGYIAFSCIPIGVLLYLSARREWRNSDVSVVSALFVALCVIGLLAIGFTAHSEALSRLCGVVELGLCFAGILFLRFWRKDGAAPKKK